MYDRHHFRFDRFENLEKMFEKGNLKREKMFEKGDLKYVVLDLLKDGPRHGYDIIKAMEQRFMGFYSPSAGSIYPILQLLQDMGYVTSAELDGKKTYSITEDGRKHLGEREQTMDRINDGMRKWWGMEERAQAARAMAEFMFTMHGLQRRTYQLDKEKLVKIKDILSKATADLKDLNI